MKAFLRGAAIGIVYLIVLRTVNEPAREIGIVLLYFWYLTKLAAWAEKLEVNE